MTNESIKMMAQLRNDIVPCIEDEGMRSLITELIDRILRCEVNDLQFRISKFNIYRYVLEDNNYPYMRCVFYDDGYRVASNSRILVATKLGYIPENEGKMIDKYGSENKIGKYLDWRLIIPPTENRYHCDITFNVDWEYKRIKDEIKMLKDKSLMRKDGEDTAVALKFKDSNGNEMFKYYSFDTFLLLLEAMKAHGIDTVSGVERERGDFYVQLMARNDNAIIIVIPKGHNASNYKNIIRIN